MFTNNGSSQQKQQNTVYESNYDTSWGKKVIK